MHSCGGQHTPVRISKDEVQYLGLKEIRGNLVMLEGVASPAPAYEEIVTIATENQPSRTGRVIQVNGDRAVVLVFEGTSGLSLSNTAITFTGKLMETNLSPELLGRTLDGLGRPIDGLGEIPINLTRTIAGEGYNPTSRVYPRNYIHTGISAIDGLATLIRGQKLPIFSADGLPHDRLAAQIAMQAQIADGENFAVVFAAMGVQHSTAEFFRRTFEESGVQDRVVMYLNLAGDPAAERIATPRFALTAAEYLAYDCGYHVLTILTDMTAYAEAVREVSSANSEIPGRKGYPGYLYSDLASIYERAGILKNAKGSLTQIPILTMPGEDITHPIPDLTGYITEGQIVLDRRLWQRGVYPPVNVLPSLSRLMKDGIGEGFTTADHPKIANMLFANYAEVGDIRALASIIGEDELPLRDKSLLEFGHRFETEFINQHMYENRSMEQTLGLARELLQELLK